MKDLVSHSPPDSWEILNRSGQNILHAAVESNRSDAIDYIQTNQFYGRLRNHKDINGNTPLHLSVASGMANNLLLNDERVDKMAFNL